MAIEQVVRVCCDGCGRTVEQEKLTTAPKGWVEVSVRLYREDGATPLQRSALCCSKACAGRWVDRRDRTKKEKTEPQA